jgi:hypothetical protein
MRTTAAMADVGAVTVMAVVVRVVTVERAIRSSAMPVRRVVRRAMRARGRSETQARDRSATQARDLSGTQARGPSVTVGEVAAATDRNPLV